MSHKFKNKYRIETLRLKEWDYGNNGYYFVTICTKNKIPYFGDVVNGRVQLSEIGKIAHKFWMEIPQHFPFIELGAFIVMPNHMHGIIIIQRNIDNNVETLHATSLQINKKNFMATISPKPGSLPTIIRSFKSAVTKYSRKINPNFSWQPRYYEHIIRSEKSFEKISGYIINNPLKWELDEYYV